MTDCTGISIRCWGDGIRLRSAGEVSDQPIAALYTEEEPIGIIWAPFSSSKNQWLSMFSVREDGSFTAVKLF